MLPSNKDSKEQATIKDKDKVDNKETDPGIITKEMTMETTNNIAGDNNMTTEDKTITEGEKQGTKTNPIRRATPHTTTKATPTNNTPSNIKPKIIKAPIPTISNTSVRIIKCSSPTSTTNTVEIEGITNNNETNTQIKEITTNKGKTIITIRETITTGDKMTTKSTD